MKFIRFLTPLILGLGLTAAVVLVASQGQAAPMARPLSSPGDPVLVPARNTHTVLPTTTVSITYTEDISAATVSTRTFAVHAMQTGLLTQTYGVDGGAISLAPVRPFKPGELVQASATTGTLDLGGDGPISPTVWHFRVAVENGTGVFSDSFQTLGTSFTRDVALGDVDGDGDLDAVAGNYQEANRIWLNDGTGVFSDSFQTLGISETMAVALGDLDADGDLDAFLGNGWGVGQPNQVWLNDGGAQGGTPGVFADSGQTLGISQTMAVALGDLDGDGDLDAFSGNDGQYDSDDDLYVGAGNTVWLNDGMGVFVDGGQMGSLPTQAVALGDLDGDGDLDAYVAKGRGTGQANRVWLNDGAGVFTDTGQTLGISQTMAVALGDLDGDGDLDAFTGNSGQSNAVWLNNGTGVFTDSGQTLGGAYTTAAALGDVDGDGDLDALAGNDGANRVWLNDGSGVFSASSPGLGSERTTLVALGDLDGDGDLDAFVGNSAEGPTAANTVWLNNKNSPVAVDDSVAVPADSSGNQLNVLANDSDPDGDTLAIAAIGTPDNGGAATISGATTISYTPAITLGTEVFTYTVSDPGGLTDTGTVTVTVGSNDPPVAVDDNATTGEDTPKTIDVLNNDSDPDGQSPFVSAVGAPTLGSAAIVDNRVEYTPGADLYGLDVFAYTISDGWLTDTAVITVTVSSIEDPPTLNPLADLEIAEDAVAQTVNLSNVTSGAFNEVQTLTVTARTSVNASIVPDPTVVYASANETGSLSFQPAADEFGNAWIEVTVSDGVTEIKDTFQVTVNAVNDPPTMSAISDRAMGEDAGTQTVAVSGISYGPTNESIQRPDLAVRAVSMNTALIPHPAVTYESGPGTYTGGSLAFAPVADQSGQTTIVATVSDGISETSRSFQVTVNAVNDPPALGAIADLEIDEDAGTQTVGLAGISTGAANEDQSLTVTAVSTDTALIPGLTVTYASPDAAGSLSFAPAADRYGVAGVVVTVNDGLAETSRSFQVTVQAVDDPPSLDPIADLAIDENAGPQTVDLSGIGAGPDESQSLTVAAASSDPGLIPHPSVSYDSPDDTGSLSFTPVLGQSGTATLVVTVSDGGLETDRSFQVAVVPAFKVIATNPSGNAPSVAPDATISAEFTWQASAGTLNTGAFAVHGRQTGIYQGSYTVGTRSAVFDALDDLKPGEEIVVNLGAGLQSTTGKALDPYTWQFRAAASGGAGLFVDSGQAVGYFEDITLSLGVVRPQSIFDTQAVALGDVDGDGDLDAYVVKNGAPSTVWLNDGNGVYSPSGQVLGSSNSWAAALGDLDGDGDLDAWVGNYQQGNTVWLNDGGGLFSDSGQLLGSSDTFAVALGDVDGDGDLDAVTGNDLGQANRVWLNGGDGAFTNSRQSLGFGDTRAIALGDLDGDGDLDVFVGNSDDQPNRVWLNDGGAQGGTLGSLSDSGQRLGGSDTYAVALADLNADGDLDAWVANMSGEPNEVWLNDGEAIFGDSGQRLGDSATYAVALGDVDADGDLDAFLGNVGYGTVSSPSNRVWLNNGAGAFGDSGQALGSDDSLAVALGDVDGDGDLDALVGNSHGLYQANKLYLNQPNAPRAADDAFYVPANADAVELDVLAQDRDPDGDALRVAAVGAPAHGSAGTDGRAVVYSPNPDIAGQDVFTYTVSDAGGLTDVAVVRVIVFEEASSTLVSPTQGASLYYTDEQGSTTIIEIPAGAVGRLTEFRYTPMEGPAGSVPGLTFAGRAFDLQAFREGALLPGLVFSAPITITIHYSDAGIAGLDEETLALRYWDGEAWAGDGIAPVARHPSLNRLVVSVTHLTEFALFGKGPLWQIYLPVVRVQSGSELDNPGSSLPASRSELVSGRNHTETKTNTKSVEFAPRFLFFPRALDASTGERRLPRGY